MNSFQPQFAKDIPLDQDDLINGEKASKLIMCIGVSSGLGRVASGFIADLPAVKRNGNRIILQQISFVSIGICTMLLTTAQLFGDNVFLVNSFLFVNVLQPCFRPCSPFALSWVYLMAASSPCSGQLHLTSVGLQELVRP